VAIKEWTTQFPTALDTVTQMSTLENESFPGADDGDNIRLSQLISIRDAIFSLQSLAGSDNLEASSLRYKVLNPNATWNYLDTTQPTDMTTDPTCIYQFDGTANSLTDRGSNGLDLASTAGTFYITMQGLVGHFFDTTMEFRHDSDALFQITGALTIEIQLYNFNWDDGRITCYCYGNDDSSSAYNYLYRIDVVNTTGQLQYFAERNTGVDITAISGALLPHYRILLLTMTRSSAGIISWYIDGQLLDVVDSGYSPTGGTSVLSKFTIGNEYRAADHSPVTPWYGIIFSYRMTADEFSAAQVLESYNRVRGII